MAYEIPVTQARAELADLINRVVYGGERVVVTRHGKPLVALVSAADLERLEELPESVEEQVVSSLSSVREVASAPASASASVSRPSTGGPAPSRAPAPVRGRRSRRSGAAKAAPYMVRSSTPRRAVASATAPERSRRSCVGHSPVNVLETTAN